MKRIVLRALTLLMAVSMLFMTACGKKTVDMVTDVAATTDSGVSSTTASGSTTTTVNVTDTSATDITTSTTIGSASITQTSVVLTKPSKTGTSASAATDPTAIFLAQFEEWLLNLTEYQKATPKVTNDSDSTITTYALVGAKNTSDYCVHVHSNKDKSIRAVYVTAEAKDYDFMFSVMAYYVYDSLGLTKLDVDAFLEQFDAFPDSLELENVSESGYRMSCLKFDEFLTFAVSGKNAVSVSAATIGAQLQAAACGGCYDDENRALNYLMLTDKGEDLGLDVSVLDRALVNGGNRARLVDVMKRAKKGEEITIGFIGGSVTEGAYASDYNKTSYAGLTFSWWEKTFPKASFTYVNAGFGGTSSLFGVHRVQADLLDKEPDFVVIEFGVNDCDHAYQTEAYANLVHRILNAPSQPAVLLLYVMNNGGSNNQVSQTPVGAHYDLPMISYRDAIWPEVKNGRYLWDEIGADYVHPTDFGHSIIAELVISYLTKTYTDLSSIADKALSYTEAYMAYVYEDATYYNRNTITPIAMNGFSVVSGKKNDSWKGGAGASITFTFTGKRCIIAIPTDYKDSLDISIRIDGGKAVKLEAYLFHGGAFSNYLAFDSDVAAEHTIEIISNSGTQHIGGLFVS